MRVRATAAACAATLCLGLAAPVLADDDKDEGGKRRYHGGERKEEFWDGNCKVKREWKKNGEYEEERKCKPGARPAYVQAAPVAVYPPWLVVQQGQPVYQPQYEPAPAPASGVFRCQSQTIGRVLGGVLGGVLGNQVGGGSGRALMTVGGAVAGVLIGGEIGRRVDASDQGCVGQVLEFAPAGQRVQWPAASTQYAVVPGQAVRRGDRHCRPYTFEQQMADGRWQRVRENACRRSDGVWVEG